MIGAGSSGIAALKALAERGIPVDCFEKSDRVGGNWVFANQQRDVLGLPVAAHQHLARADGVLGLPDAARRIPDFPHHTQIAQYFADYARPLRADRADHVRDRRARRATRDPADGVWTVTLDTGETRRYDALLVANGHHWDPRWPEPPYPGSFDGVQMHSHHFVDAERLSRRRPCWWWGWATARWTSRSSRASWLAARWYPAGAASTSSRSTCSGGRSTRSRSAR